MDGVRVLMKSMLNVSPPLASRAAPCHATQNTGQTLMLQTSDLGTVEVTLSDSTYSGSLGQFVTVVGRVDDHGERVRGFRCIDLGDKLGEPCRSGLLTNVCSLGC